MLLISGNQSNARQFVVMSAGFGRRGEPPAVVVTLLVCMCVCVGNTDARHFSSQWAAHIEGGTEHAQRIAQRHGFTFLGEIFPDCYHLQHSSVARRSISPSNEHHDNLLSEREVKWARQQKVISRSKRDFTKTQSLFPLNDPKWTQMWYLNRGSGLDMSVQEAWNEGVTGKGVVVTILDDGLERDHPDLLKNYDPQASYDVNNHDDDPMPRYDLIDSNRHGTRCAGEVAAVANNSLCSVGIAYNANIGGVRMLDGDVTDAVEARSLSLNPQHIDIYSASWGPDDDGKTVDGPGELAVRAFMEGVTKGRGGKGSIFIWASGNGGRDHDNCNCDGYTNSIWTLSISSATEKGFVPWYSEACSSTLATTYSSGSNGEKQVITTDLHRMCTVSHSGTSASAPLAAGICALALEANPQLTWRDMQHIVVATARPANLKAPDWTTNGVGRNVSHSFGYGLMDAAEMVKLSRKWRTVPEQQRCEVIANHSDKLIPAKSSVKLILDVKECPGVNYLEHVQAKISLNAQRRGDLQIHLTSPSGTKSTLLARRPHDVSRVGFQQWPFMSVHTWGESPVGVWHLEIHNEGRFLGQLQDWTMMFYGTESAPMSAIDHEQRRPSTIKMATGKTAPKVAADTVTGAPDSSGAPPDTAPKTHANQPSNAPKTPPPEVSEVFNTVRDHGDDHGGGTVAKNHGPFDATSSADNLICRRSANICLGLCLISLFYVRFLFDNYIELPVIGDKYGGKKYRNLKGDRKEGIGKDGNLKLSESCCKKFKETLDLHSDCKIGKEEYNYLQQPIDADSCDNLGRRKLNSDSKAEKGKGIYRYLDQAVGSDNFCETNRDKVDDREIGIADKEEKEFRGDHRTRENAVKKEKVEGMNEKGFLFIDDDVFCQINIGDKTKVKVVSYEDEKQRRTDEEKNGNRENLVINGLQPGIKTEDLSFGSKRSENIEEIPLKCMNKNNYSLKIELESVKDIGNSFCGKFNPETIGENCCESLKTARIEGNHLELGKKSDYLLELQQKLKQNFVSCESFERDHLKYLGKTFEQNFTNNNELIGNFLYSRNRTDVLSKFREQKLVNNFEENHLDYIFDMSFEAFYTLSDSMKEIYEKTTKNKFDSIFRSSLWQSSYANFHDLDKFGEIFLKSINGKHPSAFLRQKDQETHKFIDFVFDKNLIDTRPANNEYFKQDELKLRNVYHSNSGDFGNPNCCHKTYLSSQNNTSNFENKSNNLELILMLMNIALLVEILNKFCSFYKFKHQNIHRNFQDDLLKLINQSTSSKDFYKCNIQDISHNNQDGIVKYFDKSLSSQESDKKYFQVHFYFSDNELEKSDQATSASKFHKSNFQNRLVKSVQSTSEAGFEIGSLNPLGNFTSSTSGFVLNCNPNNNIYSTKVHSTENTKNNYMLILNFRNILDKHCQKNDKSKKVAEYLEFFYCLTCIVLLNGCKIGGFCRGKEIVPSQNTSKISHSLPKQTRLILL